MIDKEIKNDLDKTNSKRIIFSFLILLMGFALNLIINSKISKALNSAENFGDFVLFTQLIFMLGTIATIGCDLAVERYIPLFIFRKKYIGVAKYIKLFVNVIFKSFVAISSVLLIFKFLIFNKLHDQLFSVLNSIYTDYIYLMLTAIVLNAAFFYIRLIRNHNALTLSLVCYQLLQYIIFLGLIKYFSPKDLADFIILFCDSWVINLLIILFIYYKYYSKGPVLKSVIRVEINNVKIPTVIKDGYSLLISGSTNYAFYPTRRKTSHFRGRI